MYMQSHTVIRVAYGFSMQYACPVVQLAYIASVKSMICPEAAPILILLHSIYMYMYVLYIVYVSHSEYCLVVPSQYCVGVGW